MEGPSLERLKELESGLNAVNYSTKIAKRLAQQLLKIAKTQLTSPEDIMGVLLYSIPAYWNFILQQELVAHDEEKLVKDVEEILKALFKWLESIGYVEEWDVEGEEDWDYTIGVSYEAIGRKIVIGLAISDKVKAWLEYYGNLCGRRG